MMKRVQHFLGSVFLLIAAYALLHKNPPDFIRNKQATSTSQTESRNPATSATNHNRSHTESAKPRSDEAQAFLHNALPKPEGPEGVSWRLDYQDKNFLTFQAHIDDVWIFPYELRYELVQKQWRLIEGSPPPPPLSVNSFPQDMSFEETMEDIDNSAESIKLYQKQWWINADNSYVPVYQVEMTFYGKKKEFWFINAKTHEVLKTTTRARH